MGESFRPDEHPKLDWISLAILGIVIVGCIVVLVVNQ